MKLMQVKRCLRGRNTAFTFTTELKQYALQAELGLQDSLLCDWSVMIGSRKASKNDTKLDVDNVELLLKICTILS